MAIHPAPRAAPRRRRSPAAVGRPRLADAPRPACPKGHSGASVQLDGTVPCRWAGTYTRQRYRCVRVVRDADGRVVRRLVHKFVEPMTPRQPTAAHPHYGATCPTCERTFRRGEGMRTGRAFLYTVREMAYALKLVGLGLSYREASAVVRRSVGRYRPTVATLLGPAVPLPEPAAAAHDGDGTDGEDSEPFEWRLPEPGEAGPEFWNEPEDEGDEEAWDAAPWADTPDDGLLALADELLAGDSRLVADSLERRAALEVQRTASRNAAIITAWVDHYAGLVTPPAAAWPSTVMVDSVGLRTRAHYGEAEGSGAKAGGDTQGEIFVAMDATGRQPVPFLLKFSGNRDAESWAAFFRSVPGPGPRWVVTDGDGALETAVAEVWPGAVHYRCEQHLRRNGEAKLKADRVRRGPGWDPGPLWAALNEAQWTEARWAAFAAAVEAAIPARHRETRKWIAETSERVLGQVALRKLNPHQPRSIGPAETVLQRVAKALEDRVAPLRNARRLDLLLGLMASELAGTADLDRYAFQLAQELGATGGRVPRRPEETEVVRLDKRNRKVRPSVWARHQDHGGANSLLDAIAAADARGALAYREDQDARRSEQQLVQRAEQAVNRARAGLAPAPGGRKLRPPHATYRKVGGKKVADLPDLIAQWNPTRNRDMDPTRIVATSPRKAWWVCWAHLGDGHLHEWEAAIKQRATNMTGCPMCLNRAVCPSNSLAALFPEVAAEWHPTKNGGRRPEDYLPGADKETPWWKCRACRHVFRKRISARTIQAQGCPKCVEKRRLERIRQTTAERQRRKRALASEARGLLASRAAKAPPEHLTVFRPEELDADGF